MSKGDPELQDLDDLDLVDGFKRRGDNRYFEEIFNRHFRTILRICQHLMQGRDSAEDMAQRSFVRALEEIGSFDSQRDDSNLEHWLKRIAKNVCIDERRAKRRRGPAASVDKLERFQGASVDPERSVTLREALEALGSMEERYRICYLLKLEGLSYEEIARETGFTPDEVKTYIRTAQRRIDRRFELKT
jgi:RNA polymerase sigma-70 factor (ECF subfamily)